MYVDVEWERCLDPVLNGSNVNILVGGQLRVSSCG